MGISDKGSCQLLPDVTGKPVKEAISCISRVEMCAHKIRYGKIL